MSFLSFLPFCPQSSCSAVSYRCQSYVCFSFRISSMVASVVKNPTMIRVTIFCGRALSERALRLLLTQFAIPCRPDMIVLLRMASKTCFKESRSLVCTGREGKEPQTFALKITDLGRNRQILSPRLCRADLG